MVATTFEQFAKSAKERGFGEALVREWDADAHLDTHTHPFDATLLVVRGEYWLTVGDQVHHLEAGDTFTVARNVAHSEKYGPEGTTLWVARRTEQ